MEVLCILFYFQLSGIIISFVIVYNDRIIYRKYLSITTRKLIFANRTNITWMIEYLQNHPKKVFKKYFGKSITLPLQQKSIKNSIF